MLLYIDLNVVQAVSDLVLAAARSMLFTCMDWSITSTPGPTWPIGYAPTCSIYACCRFAHTKSGACFSTYMVLVVLVYMKAGLFLPCLTRVILADGWQAGSREGRTTIYKAQCC